MTQILDVEHQAIARAIAGDWSVADRIELYWLTDHVTPVTADGEYWLDGEGPHGSGLVPTRIRRGWGPRASTLVEWELGYRCPMCFGAPYWQALECETCSGRGHFLASSVYLDVPAGVLVRTDLEGLVIEEVWAHDRP